MLVFCLDALTHTQKAPDVFDSSPISIHRNFNLIFFSCILFLHHDVQKNRPIFSKGESDAATQRKDLINSDSGFVKKHFKSINSFFRTVFSNLISEEIIFLLLRREPPLQNAGFSRFRLQRQSKVMREKNKPSEVIKVCFLNYWAALDIWWRRADCSHQSGGAGGCYCEVASAEMPHCTLTVMITHCWGDTVTFLPQGQKEKLYLLQSPSLADR